MLRPPTIVRAALFERLYAKTGWRVSAGEQSFLMREPWAEQDLREERDDRFLEVLERFRECKRLDSRSSMAPEEILAGHPREKLDATPGEATDPVDVRTWVLSRQMRRSVEGTRDVREVREALFGDHWQRLSEAEAYSLLASPAPRFLSKEEFDHLGIPLLGHEATIGNRLIEPLPDGLSEVLTLSIRWPHGSQDLPRRVAWRRHDQRIFRFPNADGSTGAVQVCAGSCFDVLREAALIVREELMVTEEVAVWFLLTGSSVVIRALRVSSHITVAMPAFFEFATITLTAQPFVSPAIVAAEYARAQHKLLKHRRGREFAESNLMLLDFVRDWIQRPGTPVSNLLVSEGPKTDAEWKEVSERIPWREVLAEWNRITKPEWRYEDHILMRRDYLRTNKAVLFPGYFDRPSELGRRRRTARVKPAAAALGRRGRKPHGKLLQGRRG